MKSRKILVTGGTGFIGRHLVEHLLSSGHNVVLATRTSTRCPIAWRNEGRVRIVETGPIEAAADLKTLFPGVEAVVHLAGLAHVLKGDKSEAAFLLANATATKRLANAAADTSVRVFVHASSIVAAMHNASTTTVNDELSDRPALTPFGRSKQQAEAYVAKLAELGIFATSLRLPLVVGADARGNWALLQRLAATGLPLPFASVSNRRSLLGIDSLTRAIAHIVNGTWPASKSGTYCLADEERLSLPQVITALRNGMALPTRLFAVPPSLLNGIARLSGKQQMATGLFGNLEVDASYFHRTFGFNQEKPLLEAIENSAALYQQSRGGGSPKGDTQ